MPQEEIVRLSPPSKPLLFTEDQAESLTSILITTTKRHANKVNSFKSQLSCIHRESLKAYEIRGHIDAQVEKWSYDMRRLGVIPLAMWKVKIPSMIGPDYFWEHPQNCIEQMDL